VAWALGLSAAVHLAGLAGMAWLAATNALAFRSMTPPWSEPAVPSEEVLLVPETDPLTRQPDEEFIRTDGHPNAAHPPERSRFHSDRNTAAASNLPPDPDGIKDAPTQEGIDVPIIEVVRQELIEGEGVESAPAEVESPPAASTASAPDVTPSVLDVKPPAAASVEQTVPSPPAENEPSPTVDLVATTEASDAAVSVAPPSAAAESIRSLREPTPEVQDQPPERDTATESSATPPPAAATRAPAAPRFQSHSTLTKLRGTISNQGASSVDAADTAVGRYMKQVTSAIEKEWHRKRRRYADFVTYGTIRLEFYVNKAGKVENLTIRNRNGANAIMQDFTLNAVLDAALPPMPADLPEIVDHDRLQITYDIIVY
jgi:outer membrane biosynthesis protein TonB